MSDPNRKECSDSEKPNSSDTISRQAALNTLHMDIDIIPFAKAREYARAVIETVYNRLEELPSAQPEIIRCAECKWFQCNMSMDGYLPKGVDEFECRHWCGSCDPVDFCSYAERETNESD